MSLFEAYAKVEKPIRREGPSTSVTKQHRINLASIPVLAWQLEVQYPGVVPNTNAMVNSGYAPNGEDPMVPFAAIRSQNGITGTATVHFNGKLTLAGEFVDLKWPLETEEYDAIVKKIAAGEKPSAVKETATDAAPADGKPARGGRSRK